MLGEHAGRNYFPPLKFPAQKTLYNLLRADKIILFKLTEVFSTRYRRIPSLSKRISRRSINERPLEVVDKNTFRHWKADTVPGQKRNGDPTVLTIAERLTRCYLSIWIDRKTTDGIAADMKHLKEQYGENCLRSSAALPPTIGVSLRASPLLKPWAFPIPILRGNGLSTRESTAFCEDSYPKSIPFTMLR